MPLVIFRYDQFYDNIVGCSKEVNGIKCWVCSNEYDGEDFQDWCSDEHLLANHTEDEVPSQIECPALVTQCALGRAGINILCRLR